METLVSRIESSVEKEDWGGIAGIAINPQKAESLDRAIFFAPKNGDLKSSKFLSIKDALDKWSDMAEFIMSGAKEGDWVLRLDWEYEAEHGTAKLEQYYIVTSIGGKFYIRM